MWACLLCQTSEASALMEVAAEWQVVLHRAEEYAAMTGRPYVLETVFRYAAHTGCIKCLRVGGNFLVSGSTDEHVKLYDMRRCVEYGELLKHEGSITALRFAGSSAAHMLSCSEDGTICVWRRRDWECLKTLRAHKGAVNTVAVHPSGKLALSAGRDKQLITWNLVKGRVAYQTALKREASVCAWGVGGASYAVVQDAVVTVFNMADGEELARYNNRLRIHDVVFLSDKRFALASEDGVVRIVDVADGGQGQSKSGSSASATASWGCDVVTELQGHTSRVKALQLIESDNGQDGVARFLVSVSSDSHVRVWQLPDAGDDQADIADTACVALVNTRARLTCVDGYAFVAPSGATATAATTAGHDEEGSDVPADDDAEVDAKAKKDKPVKRKRKADDQRGAAKANKPSVADEDEDGAAGGERKKRKGGSSSGGAATTAKKKAAAKGKAKTRK